MQQVKQGSSARPSLRAIGFTLAEILVALALIALLAAVLLPTVAGQIIKGDASRVAQDLEGVRVGISSFVADVHRYPGKYSDMSKLITTSDLDINGAAYSNGLTKQWAGPYIAKDTINSVVPTGFGATILNGFGKAANTNGVQYVNVRIIGIASADFDKIDAQIDGPSTNSTQAQTTGLLRFITGTPDTVRFMAVPIQ
jgi:prepilin-type N-terminal cleavage/methylation domain-containing protein